MMNLSSITSRHSSRICYSITAELGRIIVLLSVIATFLYVPNFRNTKKSAFYFHVPTTSSTTDSDCLCVGMRWADLKGGRHPSLTVNCTAVPNRPRRCADQFNPNNVISMTDIHIYKA